MQGKRLQRFCGILPESQGQNLVSFVPYSLDNGQPNASGLGCLIRAIFVLQWPTNWLLAGVAGGPEDLRDDREGRGQQDRGHLPLLPHLVPTPTVRNENNRFRGL